MKQVDMKRMMAFFAVALLWVGQAFAEAAIEGSVFEQDGATPIEGAEVMLSGIGFEGDTLLYLFYSDTLGHYEGTLDAGVYRVSASAFGYQTVYLADSLTLEENETLSDVDFLLQEVFHPVRYVTARQYVDDLVRVSWSMHEPQLYEDFETGDFSRFSWNNTLSDHPWAIDSTHAYNGSCCMKSTCEGIEGGMSEIEVWAYVPFAGEMSFFARVSSEMPWDVGRFYLDGVKKLECSGNEAWTEHRFDVTPGEHLFRWTYTKDASTDEGDDCFYVDDIRFYVDDSAKMARSDGVRSFQYYDLFRRRFDGEPVLLASRLTDTMFMEMNWNSLSWGQYQWGVSCYYEGNRGVSDTVWSVFLDKEMTVAFEINATTNVGIVPAGATVQLASHEGQGHTYQATLDADGHLLLGHVYRDAYDLRVHLDGFADYVAEDSVSIWEPTQMQIELQELVLGIDSLYVSSTGWAMWHLAEGRSRDLQYVELLLDQLPAGTTSDDGFQFDVSQLEAGTTYLAQARPVYLSGAGEWQSCAWTYQACSNFQGSPDGLTWAVHDEAVLLSWSFPEGDALLGAMLYRDGEFLVFTDEEAFMDLTVEMHDDVEYCLRLVYDGPTDGTYYSMSCEECAVATFPAYCDPPVKLEGENYLDANGEYGALISWGERPEPVNHWLRYDDGAFKTSLGSDALIFWSIRFEAEDLADYVGMSLSKVSLFDVSAGTYQLWVYVGGDEAPRTPVRSQNMILSGTNAWHEEALVPAFEVPENEPIWIVVGQQGLNRPAAACADMGNPNGRWVSQDGATWFDMHHFNMYYTWMLRAFVTNQSGRPVPIANDGFSLQHYNLYRSYDNMGYQQIATVPFAEGQDFYQYRDVLVDDGHHEFYYRLTAVYLSDEGDTCESDYAASLWHPEDNYVWVDDHWLVPACHDSEVEVYPNPASDVLFIEGHRLKSVAVFNALGQKLLEEACNADALQLHLSGWSDGLYWLRVATQNGVAVQRFVIGKR